MTTQKGLIWLCNQHPSVYDPYTFMYKIKGDQLERAFDIALEDEIKTISDFAEKILEMEEVESSEIQDLESEIDDLNHKIDSLEMKIEILDTYEDIQEKLDTIPERIYKIDNQHDMEKLELFTQIMDQYSYIELKSLFKE